MDMTWLAERRRELGYNQTELARILGLNRKTIYCYETARRNPSAENLEKLKRILSINGLVKDKNLKETKNNMNDSPNNQNLIKAIKELLENSSNQEKPPISDNADIELEQIIQKNEISKMLTKIKQNTTQMCSRSTLLNDFARIIRKETSIEKQRELLNIFKTLAAAFEIKI